VRKEKGVSSFVKILKISAVNLNAIIGSGIIIGFKQFSGI
jgi:hypothetical protein